MSPIGPGAAVRRRMDAGLLQPVDRAEDDSADPAEDDAEDNAVDPTLSDVIDATENRPIQPCEACPFGNPSAAAKQSTTGAADSPYPSAPKWRRK
jgi:hypothetical protein